MFQADPPAAARTAFDRRIEDLSKDPGRGNPAREGFGSRTLFAGAGLFVHLEDSGALVLRLPPERADQLITDRTGTAWGLSPGSALKGHLSVPLSRRRQWVALAREARAWKSGARATAQRAEG